MLCALACASAFLHKGSLSRTTLVQNQRFLNEANRVPLYQPSPPRYSPMNPNNRQPLKDILGLGPAEIAITLVVGLVLFGPETLKSLSKDVGKAAAELKEIPKTFKEGMEEGAESTQVSKMKAIAAEKRKKRDAKKAAKEVSQVYTKSFLYFSSP